MLNKKVLRQKNMNKRAQLVNNVGIEKGVEQ